MRQFPIDIEEEFRAGLKPDISEDYATRHMSECLGMRSKPGGLFKPNPITRAVSAAELSSNSITAAWPHPQLFIGREISLLVDTLTVWSVDASWALTQISTFDPNDTGSTKAVTGDDIWHFIDLGEAWFLLNGTSTIFTPKMGQDTPVLADKTYIQNNIHINTGAYRPGGGQILFGGFTDGQTWPEPWNNLHPNSVLWTSFGRHFDAVWGLTTGLHTTAESDSLTEAGDAGSIRLSWPGEVLRILPLGDQGKYIVYGEDGISLLTPTLTDHDNKMKVFSYGETVLRRVGILGRGAVGGNSTRHIFLDTSGVLWSLRDGELRRLGYRNYLDPMLGNTVIINYDEEEDEAYVSDGTVSFLLTEAGLTESKDVVNSLIFFDGGLVGMVPSTDESFAMTSDIFDMELSGFKTIRHISVKFTDITSLRLRIHYKNDNATTFLQTAWFTVYANGDFFPSLSAHHFKIELDGTAGAEASIRSVKVNYQTSDNRFRREMPSNARSSRP